MDTNKNNTTPLEEPKRLYRLPKKGIVAGIAAGLADYFNLDTTLMRLLFIIAIFVTNGLIIIVYFVAALIIPTPEEDSLNSENLERKVDSFARDISSSSGSSRTRNWIGIALIVFGAWLLARSIVPELIDVDWSIIISVLLIIIGLLFVVRGKK